MEVHRVAPAGWYPDPLELSELRWWDGGTWTEEVSGSREVHVLEPTLAGSMRTDSGPELSSRVRLAATGVISEVQPQVWSGDPPSVGTSWGPLIEAMRSAGSRLIAVEFANLPELRIDMAERVFWWDVVLSELPQESFAFEVRLEASLARPPVAGRDLEALLWMTGTTTTDHSIADGLDMRLRYKLRRWPNLASLPHTTQDLRMTSILAYASLTPAKLSVVAGAPLPEVRVLLGTYVLMGLVVASADSGDSAAERQPVPARSGGLFDRLRDRFRR